MKQINKKILQFFSALSDETRLKILVTLAKEPRTVNEIHQSLGKDTLTLSAISHQLKQLHDLDVVDYKRNGRNKTFSLSDNFCWCILNDAFKHFDGKTKCKVCSHIKSDIKI